MSYIVFVLDDAEEDLWGIHAYIKNQFSETLANDIYIDIRDSILMLEKNPHLGTVVPQLAALGMTQWRQRCSWKKTKSSMKLKKIVSIFMFI